MPRPVNRAPRPTPHQFNSEDSDVFMTRSLSGSASIHGLPDGTQTVRTTPALGSQDSQNCNCGHPAKLLTVQKEGANKGKKFYSCSNNRTCNYFCWEEQVGSTQVATGGTANTTQVSRSSAPSSANSTQRTSFSGTDLQTSDVNIVCTCGESAKKLTVRKEGPNHGRDFFTCNTRTCQFFLWADAAETDADKGSSTFTNTSRNNTGSSTSWTSNQSSWGSQQPGSGFGGKGSGSTGGEKSCTCGDPAVTMTVKKDGPNKGRLFWTCSKPFNQKCNLFEWADDSSGGNGGGSGGGGWEGGGGGEGFGGATQNPRKRPAPDGGNGQGKGKRCCSICRQPGHRRSNCPNL